MDPERSSFGCLLLSMSPVMGSARNCLSSKRFHEPSQSRWRKATEKGIPRLRHVPTTETRTPRKRAPFWFLICCLTLRCLA